MLYRKIEEQIEAHLRSNSDKILLVDGARQVGKTFIIRHVGQKLFKNFIEINMLEDAISERLFDQIRGVEDFYLKLSISAGNKMGNREDTLVFIDEIQAYPELLSLLKFLSQDSRFHYIASGSLLGITLFKTSSIPMGSIRKLQMFPLDFEEFLYANSVSKDAVTDLKNGFETLKTPDEALHNKLTDLFRKFLLIGGLPEAVKSYIEENNIQKIREIQREIHEYYGMDASKYDIERNLKIKKVFDLVPSNMENKKKRVVAKEIEDKKGMGFRDYQDEFDYLLSSGIALGVEAISNPVFPLLQSSRKNLIKLYLNDVGLLSAILYGNNVAAILKDERSINLGSIYETVVASELSAHGHRLFYYDRRGKGEVDFLIDDYESLSILPIEVKSGKDYAVHSALNTFLKDESYPVKRGIVLSNEREIKKKGSITYLPIYFVMFL